MAYFIREDGTIIFATEQRGLEIEFIISWLGINIYLVILVGAVDMWRTHTLGLKKGICR